MYKKFNKRNLNKFADNLITEDSKGNISYVPLCHGALAKANGEILHCALGELYASFVGTVMRPATTEELENGSSDEGNFSFNFITMVDDEQSAVEDLINIANIRKVHSKKDEERLLKKSNTFGIYSYDGDDAIEELLYNALCEGLPKTNDKIKGKTEKSMIARARKVQEKLHEIANEYLV